ncbi:hypothetical protein D9758_005733 [Tetrapyrgos nigripes]|uniref:G-patch domain-containing protein n=1 Tax=Tetrapyrgos nigripes TaxID=182062 RepID=A0A8H5GJW7_9AGAR|nr:hypothetical protein D9758_005733 [Tetrapyrgos nigripes]
MPLDGHSYLVSQGWSGKGTGLRQGAISRPITIAQKNNLGGLGKDRDEAFPFWDHLFTAASKAITLKIDNSDESDTDSTTPPVPLLKRTSTGILSNRRPVDLPSTSTSGTSTPEPSNRLSLLAHAKREAARRHLYSRFYRGLVITQDTDTETLPTEEPEVPTIAIHSSESPSTSTSSPNTDANTKKRKRKPSSDEVDGDAERKERKRLKKEKKAKKQLKEKEREERKEFKAKRKLEKQARRAKKKRKMEEKEEAVIKEVVDDGVRHVDKEERKKLKRGKKAKEREKRTERKGGSES